ncbi:MAG: DUF4263 domain-containing protein [Acidobacteriota bacterium]|nr:DUF4263 domain-containing protein [Acidobacteriota bacterium]
MTKKGLPPETSLDEVMVRIKEAYRNPNIGWIKQLTLKEGPRTFRIATLMEIVDPQTGERHHYTLKLDSIDRRKTGWFSKPDRSIRLDGQDPDEIEHLHRFLTAHLEGKLTKTGDLHVIGSEDFTKLGNLIAEIPNLAAPDMVELVKVILPRIQDAHDYLDEFIEIFEKSDPRMVEYMAIAAQVVQYQMAYDSLVKLVESDVSVEHDYHKLLEANPWMFGSEYSELLDRRKWTRDESLDFMLRRTSDNFLEVIEIKTPAMMPLMRYDSSHNSHHLSANLSKVIGQVIGYIEELERRRDSIRSKDNVDTLKIRARIIAGRDGDVAVQDAIRNLNAHLHRIEILTFDQLVRIAERVLTIFKSRATGETNVDAVQELDDDIPF